MSVKDFADVGFPHAILADLPHETRFLEEDGEAYRSGTMVLNLRDLETDVGVMNALPEAARLIQADAALASPQYDRYVIEVPFGRTGLRQVFGSEEGAFRFHSHDGSGWVSEWAKRDEEGTLFGPDGESPDGATAVGDLVSTAVPAIAGFDNVDQLWIRGLPSPSGELPRLQVWPGAAPTGAIVFSFNECSDLLMTDLVVDGNRDARGAVARGPFPSELMTTMELEAQDPNEVFIEPSFGGGTNFILRSCHRVRFVRVESTAAPNVCFQVVAKSGGAIPTRHMFDECRAIRGAHNSMAVSACHGLRIRGGSYSYAGGFWTMAGINIETFGEFGDTPSTCDVLIEDADFIGNWKGIQIGKRNDIPRGITIKGCTFVGDPASPEYPVYHCQDVDDDEYDPCLGGSLGARYAAAMSIAADWVTVKDNTFTRYNSRRKPYLKAFVRTALAATSESHPTLGVIAFVGNRFTRIDNSKREIPRLSCFEVDAPGPNFRGVAAIDNSLSQSSNYKGCFLMIPSARLLVGATRKVSGTTAPSGVSKVCRKPRAR